MASGLISCICITKEHRFGLVQRAILNFLDQDHEDRELIVLCHSTELLSDIGTFVSLQGASDRIRSIFSSLSQPVDLLKLGMEKATGRWITFWDDDNQYHPQRLSRQLEASSTQQPSVIVNGWWHFFDSNEVFLVNPEQRGKRLPWRCVPYSLLFHRNNFPGFGKQPAGQPPVIRLLHHYWRKQVTPKMIRFENDLAVVGVRGDNRRGYDWHRTQATTPGEGKLAADLLARRENLEEMLDGFRWPARPLSVCGRDGQAFVYTPKRTWPVDLEPYGQPVDNIERVNEVTP